MPDESQVAPHYVVKYGKGRKSRFLPIFLNGIYYPRNIPHRNNLYRMNIFRFYVTSFLE